MGLPLDRPDIVSLSLLPNPFPVTVDGYNSSLWFTWVERVMLSHDQHADEIIAAHGGSDRIENAQQQGNADTLFTITESMYASILVAAQSLIELYHRKICTLIYIHITRTPDLYSTNSKKRASERICGKELERYIRDNVCIEISRIDYFKIADAVRVLSNIFKHHRWKYIPKHTNTIDPKVAKALGLVPNQHVIYSVLPLRDLLIGCGRYCQTLKEKLMAVFEAC